MRRFKDYTENIQESGRSMTLDDASIFLLINIIWELLLNNEREGSLSLKSEKSQAEQS